MNKTYHFLGGLPRSGNTLLAALLNQHPTVYASPLSPMGGYLQYLDQQVSFNENSLRNQENGDRTHTLTKSLFDTFYQDVQKPVVIDRDKFWGNRNGIQLLKLYVTDSPKIIFTVRDVLEIIASFVSLDSEYYRHTVMSSGMPVTSYLGLTDCAVDHLMSPGNSIDVSLMALASSFDPDFVGMFHIVEYNDLVNKTQETMDKIYEFLNLPSFTNDLSNIQKKETDREELAGHIKGLHDVHATIKPSSTNPEFVLSEYVRNKYSNLEFWRAGNPIQIRGRDFS